MNIKEIGHRFSETQVTWGAAAIVIVVQIAFLYLLSQVDGYMAALLLGILHASLIEILPKYFGITLDRSLTLSKRKVPVPTLASPNFLVPAHY